MLIGRRVNTYLNCKLPHFFSCWVLISYWVFGRMNWLGNSVGIFVKSIGQEYLCRVLMQVIHVEQELQSSALPLVQGFGYSMGNSCRLLGRGIGVGIWQLPYLGVFMQCIGVGYYIKCCRILATKTAKLHTLLSLSCRVSPLSPGAIRAVKKNACADMTGQATGFRKQYTLCNTHVLLQYSRECRENDLAICCIVASVYIAAAKSSLWRVYTSRRCKL